VLARAAFYFQHTAAIEKVPAKFERTPNLIWEKKDNPRLFLSPVVFFFSVSIASRPYSSPTSLLALAGLLKRKPR
jgi:hypothetical protein